MVKSCGSLGSSFGVGGGGGLFGGCWLIGRAVGEVVLLFLRNISRITKTTITITVTAMKNS